MGNEIERFGFSFFSNTDYTSLKRLYQRCVQKDNAKSDQCQENVLPINICLRTTYHDLFTLSDH